MFIVQIGTMEAGKQRLLKRRLAHGLRVCLLLMACLAWGNPSQAIVRLPNDTIQKQLKAWDDSLSRVAQDTMKLAHEIVACQEKLKDSEQKRDSLKALCDSITLNDKLVERLQAKGDSISTTDQGKLDIYLQALERFKADSLAMSKAVAEADSLVAPVRAEMDSLRQEIDKLKPILEDVAYERDKLIFNQYIAYSFNQPYKKENYPDDMGLLTPKSERAKPYFDAYVPLAKKHGEYSQDLKKFLIGAKGVLDKNNWSHIPPSFVTKFKTRLQNETLYGREVYKHKEVWIDLLNDNMDSLMRMADSGFAGSRSEFEAIINQL